MWLLNFLWHYHYHNLKFTFKKEKVKSQMLADHLQQFVYLPNPLQTVKD